MLVRSNNLVESHQTLTELLAGVQELVLEGERSATSLHWDLLLRERVHAASTCSLLDANAALDRASAVLEETTSETEALLALLCATERACQVMEGTCASLHGRVEELGGQLLHAQDETAAVRHAWRQDIARSEAESNALRVVLNDLQRKDAERDQELERARAMRASAIEQGGDAQHILERLCELTMEHELLQQQHRQEVEAREQTSLTLGQRSAEHFKLRVETSVLFQELEACCVDPWNARLRAHARLDSMSTRDWADLVSAQQTGADPNEDDIPDPYLDELRAMMEAHLEHRLAAHVELFDEFERQKAEVNRLKKDVALRQSTPPRARLKRSKWTRGRSPIT